MSSALAAGDLLGLSGELSLGLAGGDRRPAPALRWTLGRHDPEGGLLGPLRATRVSFSDLFSPRRPLLCRQGTGRGLEISNFPLGRPSEFDRTSLRGDALPGWEVELYHGENLIDFRVVGEDGRYELSDVPLFYGFNVLRRVFHGPQGQRREKVERLWIGPELIRAGRSHYRFAVLQPSRGQGEHPQLGARGQGEHPQLGATALAAADAGSGGEILPGTTAGDIAGSAPGAVHRYFFELERGLRHNLSVGIRLDSLPLADGRHTYTGLRLWGSAKGFLGGVDLVADNRGGWAGRRTTPTRSPPESSGGSRPWPWTSAPATTAAAA